MPIVSGIARAPTVLVASLLAIPQSWHLTRVLVTTPWLDNFRSHLHLSPRLRRHLVDQLRLVFANGSSKSIRKASVRVLPSVCFLRESESKDVTKRLLHLGP